MQVSFEKLDKKEKIYMVMMLKIFRVQKCFNKLL